MRRVTLLLAIALVAVSGAGATLTPFDLNRIRAVTAATISPDGRHVAFVLSRPRNPLAKDDDGPAWAELHVITSRGESRPFVSGDVNVSDLQWVPNSESISFLLKRGKDEHRSVYAIPLGGGEARRIVSHDADIAAHVWSPDGKQVAFLATEAEPKNRKDLEKKGFNQIVFEETARPVRIWIAEPDSAERARQLPAKGSFSDLRWSPAGGQLAAAVAPTSLVDHSYTSRRVAVIDVGSGEIAHRFENPGKLGGIEWSTDGKRLAFISAADQHDSAAGRLIVVSASGGPLRDILPGYEGHVSDVAWIGPDRLVYVGQEGVWGTLAEVGADGSNARTRVARGALSFGSVDLTADGRSAALLVDAPAHPQEVYLWQEGSAAAPRRLTRSNVWLDSIEMGRQEVVTYRARDGLSIEGVLIRPLAVKPGARVPLIVVVHGGPEAHYRNGWMTGYSSPGQMAAALGYAVFYPNYRGSTGRGVAFTKLSFRDPAGKEFDDLVDAVKQFVDAGVADPRRVGITGGSYGGYASAWGATKLSEHFAASVMFVGISNLASKWATTDIPDEEVLVHAGRYPSDDWMFHLQRSPVYWASRSRTPTLILAGKDDPRVHPGQSMELYRHLRQFGKAPVRLVLYPGEGHGNRRAASQLDTSLRMMQWFDHYLRGPGGEMPAWEIGYEVPKAEGTPAPPDAPKQEPEKKEELRKKTDPGRVPSGG